MTTQSSLKGDDIDPQIRAFVERACADFRALAGPDPLTMDRMREISEQARKAWTLGGPDMAQTLMVRVGAGERRARIHIPAAGAGKGTLIYLHGGGWSVFSIDTHDRLMREYAERIGCAVIGLDYSLSPENRFPTALNDVDQCHDWVLSAGESLGLETGHVVIGGDSAGANLALASTLRRRDEGRFMPDGLLLNYAALETDHYPSNDRYDGAPYMLDVSEMKVFWKNYLGAESTENPYARPLLADLADLPPVHLCIAECDILRDENLELERRLETVGVQVSAHLYKGATHSFLEAVGVSSCAERAVQAGADWVSDLFSR